MKSDSLGTGAEHGNFSKIPPLHSKIQLSQRTSAQARDFSVCHGHPDHLSIFVKQKLESVGPEQGFGWEEARNVEPGTFFNSSTFRGG